MTGGARFVAPRGSRMKRAALIVLACALGASSAGGGPTDRSGARPDLEASPAPVLIELFTSEGCSSCPPADRLLTALLEEQPVAGARIIALGEHVDYWNDLGWVDRFSSRGFTQRQADYQARAFPRSGIYTPQLVVDGRFELVGSDARAARQAIANAAAAPKADLRIAAAREGAHRLRVDADLSAAAGLLRAGPADLLVALVEDGLVTRVASGENGGRTLAHSAVVRRLEKIGSVRADSPRLAVTTHLPLEGELEDASRLRVVAFVQERAHLKILGAAAAEVAAAP